jgi:hypothetical protein
MRDGWVLIMVIRFGSVWVGKVQEAELWRTVWDAFLNVRNVWIRTRQALV